MSDLLSRLAPPAGARRSVRRLGRGPGCGVGKTSGKGQKGQKARHPGNFSKTRFQGGQTPIQRRLPKRGFHVPFPQRTVALNVAELERFAAGSVVDEEALRREKLLKGPVDRIRILGGGELTKKLVVHAQGFSATAVQKIEKAGGQVVVTGAAAPASAA